MMYKKQILSHDGLLIGSHDKRSFSGFSVQELQAIFQDIDHGVVIVDCHNHVVFANHTFGVMLGLTKRKQEQLVGREIADLYNRDSFTFYLDHIQKQLKKKQSWVGEIDWIGKGDEIVRTACEIVPVVSFGKRVSHHIYWLSVLEGDKVLLCPNLNEAIDFSQSLFDMAPNPIYLIDSEGKILIANQYLASITGYSIQELLQKTIYDLEESISSAKLLASLIKKLDKHDDVRFQGNLQGKERSHSVEVNLKRIMLCGHPSVLVYLHDISLRKEYQREAEYNKELRDLITKVTNRFSLVGIRSFDNAANKALGDLGKFAHVDRCYLFRLSGDCSYLINTHEWCSKYATPEIQSLQHIPAGPYMWFAKYFQGNQAFAVDRIEQMPNEYSRVKEEFIREDIKSILIVPLKRGKYVFGTVGFDAVAEQVDWDPVVIQLLTDFSNFIAQALDRRETLLLQEQKKRLEFMLTKKMLSATEEELAFFIKHVPSPIAIFNRNMHYVAVSDRWLKDFHIKKKDILGKTFYEVFSVDLLKWQKIHRRCLKGEAVSNEKDSFLGLDGKNEWIKWKAYPRRDHDNKVSGVIILAEVITERIKNEEKILHMTQYDTLTELPNRQYFREILTDLLEQQQKKVYSVLILTVNNIDEVNSYYNIFVADKLLQLVARRLVSQLTKGAFLARFDGGQFVYILDNGDKSKIARFINAIDASISQPFHINKYQIRTSISVGVRTFRANDITYEKAIKDAEIALHKAKSLSIDRVVYFNNALEKKYLRELQIENDLQEALDESQFYLVYQPLFLFETGEIIGVEVLARWRHPKLKEISPVEFIFLAEKVGKIIALGYWILDQAFRDIKHLMKKVKNRPGFIFSINLSPDQLLDKGFFPILKKMISSYDIPTYLLQFEITETKLSPDVGDVVSVLCAIKKLGCKIAIDDFGTGHSALERLNELPISTLKIDKSFVDDIDTNEKSTSLVKHILMLAGELKMTTVAEGIENKAQDHMLRFLGCDLAQGFYYSKPIPLQELERKYLNHSRKR